MWQGIWKILQNILGTKQGLYVPSTFIIISLNSRLNTVVQYIF